MIETALMDPAVEKWMTDTNRAQMMVSMRADGKLIQPEYSESYAKKKGHEFPDLFLTGDFQGSMFFVTDGVEFFLTSNDEKTNSLTDRYGENIFGIAPDNQPAARSLSLRALARLYNKMVLNG